MAKRNQIAGHIADTIVGTSVELNGELTSDGDIVIDGIVKGDVKSKGEITIGSHGVVTGNIFGRGISLSGALKGNIEAKEQVQIGHSGRLHGNIDCRGISIATGAYFVGKVTMPEPSDDVVVDIEEESAPQTQESAPQAEADEFDQPEE
jgi:cytoskeletal protein CcmA (bactofilin family)